MQDQQPDRPAPFGTDGRGHLREGAVEPHEGLPQRRRGQTRPIGASVAGAVAGVILAQMTVGLGGHALPVAARLRGRGDGFEVVPARSDGFEVVPARGAGAAALAFLLASFLPRHRPAVQGNRRRKAREGAGSGRDLQP
ncbi:hypothetical protein GCM10010503_63220 [Streptomyces lucensis JCM 4490]|uniref:Uncharacterized protein n=1 Tax=Streptomyces lucensis JCM 4490 TaxID=1306176 RepID=A0A918JEE7_9ACTN|nr:hypothetical protein [Streptomyces lucensis]GGW76821.1 hypothetical protein GCM10010503_63220 [Streptomyces lucensis JCM 4490]